MKNEKGITLIALIITIVVMLILVGVVITVTINSGLIDKASKAANETQAKYQDEAANIGTGFNVVQSNGTQISTDIDNYVRILSSGE